ncbi:tyrosine--tRNA ligase [Lawsonia intracellularis]|uniref:Tyrosine--tRNA ligase n=1 Tax=Lawsonia intracellularis (strain PHE/MN1-00) TaxID=363253 RepID=Q1MSE7_LAWIP|nr:tyrosine--tRNA ligase [Lawsonia intracellularis]AGC49422.1 tyrosyl-tRNA synthetase [Lawsonia intracellularis N343]KAA0204937.1 tyrosine--tRNA ligase [Lawsonia intracellularis]MBZ3893170.1 tyrosine--tRNA ligase [Lawsonia intracellularis]OMQ06083.1 tyrosine--tRNA ligase [Lawsonia intracellularis]RBN32514.1 tyrosine--tRNA ligase [Lawsonia intracellularis]
MVSIDDQLQLIKRGYVELINEESLRKKLSNEKPLVVKAGFDPTAPDLHLGHTVLIHKLRHFQQLGHNVTFLIGDFTGLIGDPSGRSTTRPALTVEQVQANAETYKKQIFKILDPLKTNVVFNSKWLMSMSSVDFIRLASHYTLARMLERDDFSNRYKENTPIALHELLYPLMQGYDSVALKSDIELGGTDQKFNLLVGRTLMSHYNIEPQCILTMPLLEGLDGVRKMSKSYGNYVGIDEQPYVQFSKVMSISDELMWRYYELISTSSLSEVEKLKQNVKEGHLHPKKVKEQLAVDIVTQYHGKEKAYEALQEFTAVFVNGALPDDTPEFICNYGETSKPPAFLTDSKLCTSRSEAKRLIKQGSLTVNDKRYHDVELPLEPGDYIIKLGKKRFLRLQVQ